MRRFHPFLASVLIFASACNQAPKPEKAENLDKIEPKDTEPGDAKLGPLPTGPIGKVGDVEVSNAAFREIYDLKIQKYAERGREIPKSADRRYRKSIADRLIYQEVLRQEAAALGVSHDAAELKERLDEQRLGSRDWVKQLARRGETENSLTEMYKAELVERAILEKLGRLAVTETDIEDDYQKIKDNWTSDKPRIRASHILVPVGPAEAETESKDKEKEKSAEPKPEGTPEEQAKWDAEAKAKAEQLYKVATAEGADFAKIAEENSVGPSAKKGGDLGLFTPDRMAEEFSNVAFKMEPGQISKPVKTKFGYHIIKVVGKWPPGSLPKEALLDQIDRRIRQRNLHRGRKELKSELLAKYKIVNNIEATLGPDPEKNRPPRKRRTPMSDPHTMNPHFANPHGRRQEDAGAAKEMAEPEDEKAPVEDKAGEPGDEPEQTGH